MLIDFSMLTILPDYVLLPAKLGWLLLLKRKKITRYGFMRQFLRVRDFSHCLQMGLSIMRFARTNQDIAINDDSSTPWANQQTHLAS